MPANPEVIDPFPKQRTLRNAMDRAVKAWNRRFEKSLIENLMAITTHTKPELIHCRFWKNGKRRTQTDPLPGIQAATMFYYGGDVELYDLSDFKAGETDSPPPSAEMREIMRQNSKALEEMR